MLTLFVLHGDVDELCDERRTILSFEELFPKIYVIDRSDLRRLIEEVKTDWYGYMFSDEWIEERMLKALPEYFSSDYDAVTIMRMKVDEWAKPMLDENNRPIISQAPRFFRRWIRLNENRVPLEPTYKSQTIEFERALDGFILGR